VFKILGVKAIIARSFSRIYYRNLINNGIPAINLNWKNADFSSNDLVEIILEKGVLTNSNKDLKVEFSKIPSFITEILEEGGILNRIIKTLKNEN